MLIARSEKGRSKNEFGAKKILCARVGNAAGLSARATEWWGPTHWWTEVFLEVDNDESGFEGFV
jgi:hypothetical protein